MDAIDVIVDPPVFEMSDAQNALAQIETEIANLQAPVLSRRLEKLKTELAGLIQRVRALEK